MPYLPSGESLPQTAEEIQNTLTSPQFQQVDAGSGGKCTPPSPFPILLIHLALLFQVPGTVQSGKLLSRSGKEEGHGLMEH